jgi:hypothetical protein
MSGDHTPVEVERVAQIIRKHHRTFVHRRRCADEPRRTGHAGSMDAARAVITFLKSTPIEPPVEEDDGDDLSRRCREITRASVERAASKVVEAALDGLPRQVCKYHWNYGVFFILIDSGEVLITAPHDQMAESGKVIARIPALEWQSIVGAMASSAKPPVSQEEVERVGRIIDSEAWEARDDGRDVFGTLWGVRREWAMVRAGAILEALSSRAPSLPDEAERLREALAPLAAMRLSTEPEVSDLVLRSAGAEMRRRAEMLDKHDADILRARAALSPQDGPAKEQTAPDGGGR